MPRLLSKLKIDEISSVDRPANPGARIMLMKRFDDRYAEPRGRKTLFEHQEAARAAYEAARGKKGKNKMNKMISVAKHLLEGGTLVSHNRDDFFKAMQEGAEKIKKSGETSAQAFARYVEQEPDGRLLMRASKLAPPAAGAPPQMATTALSAPYRQLLDRARDLRQRDPRLTEAQAFACVYGDPQHADLTAADKSAHVTRVSKRGIGEKPPTLPTAADDDADELHDKIRRKAAKLQRKNPSLTPAQALMAIFESRKPKDKRLVTKYISAAA